MRGYSLAEAFTQDSPALTNAKPPKQSDEGIKLNIENAYSRTLIERTDPRGNVAYGIRHTPDAHVKLFNASKTPDASIAMSYGQGHDMFEDVVKVVRRPTGGYELHLQKIHTLVLDGKRIDTSSLSKFL